MSNPQSNDYPGANAMGDTLAFVKQLWGSMKIPGMSIPSLSPEDIDKQIADLKAVESWLQVNMNMLRSSIQALEVQSATLTALRSVSESFAKAAAGGGGATTEADDKPAFESPFQPPFQSAFQSAFGSPFHSTAQSKSASASEPLAGAEGTPDPTAMAAPFAHAAVWWNAMQEQFSNAVSQAMQQSAPPEPKPSKKAAKEKTTTNKTPAGKTTSSQTTTAKRAKSKKPAVSQPAAKRVKKDTSPPASGSESKRASSAENLTKKE